MKTLKIPPFQPKQKLFCEADTPYVCYGGAKGGGKTHVVRYKAILMALNYPGIKILIVRATYGQLNENFTFPMQTILAKTGLARWKDNDKSFCFENGSRIKLGFCDKEADGQNYIGLEYDVVFIDEATQLSYTQYIWVSSTCRGVNDFPKRVYLTCNPGGKGHEWVKRLFIDRDYINEEKAEDYTFIQAKVEDNPALKEKDPHYMTWLNNLPDGQREAWRDGKWDVFVGQYFSEFSTGIHVMKPKPIPAHWKRYVTMDYGYSDMCAVLWIAIDELGRNYVYNELYENQLAPSEAAKKILEKTGDQKIESFIAPPDLFAKQNDGGRSTAVQFGENGIYLTQASNRRVDGWLAVKEQLKLIDTPDGGKTANLKIYTNCINLIDSLPKLQYDTDKLDGDILKEPHKWTHAPDALRYFCISYTSATKPLHGKPVPQPFKFTPTRSTVPSASGYGDLIGEAI